MKITAKKVLTSAGWAEKQTVEVNKQHIVSIRQANDDELNQCLDGYLIPGFFDTQVNGGGGILFNATTSYEGICQMADAHLQYGTTSMLPTIITDNADVMAKAADAISACIAQQHPQIAGVHFEGPFLSVAKKGVHSAELIRPPSDRELAILCRKDIGRVLTTLAPEHTDAGLIRELVSENVVVALGHTNASYEQARAALDAGASGFTHLYNAMSAMTSRAPGVVGAALSDEDSFCGLIVDHHHVHPASARAAIRAKSAGRMMLVTDAMAHVGSSLTRMPFFDREIMRSGDKLTTADGTLAGSCLDMLGAVINTHRDLGFTLEQAVMMAAATPAAFMGLAQQQGSLAPGQQASMLLLDSASLQIRQTWLAGKAVNLPRRSES
ncbi:N-acetylglucosamine-6-phosphate deacetylase [Alteromonas halophila]|uniref:N-acetylgalactosamine-6-phosphate deacetylase n=1 Tax=Alteromonas halophila TaxID=516698 RepID=A0A918MXG7_9ALTE|nr:N-acetylglucosamine-6-phosphate deacetylase [Alteromonas halophila]GGW81460.1 N-acetylgalactosamine-6-phosphate deacetylase [Alteromonas halophila]